MKTGKLFIFKSTCTREPGVTIRKCKVRESVFRCCYQDVSRKTVEWALEPSAHYKKLKKLLPLPRIELRFVGLSVLNPVTTPTELARLHIYIYNCKQGMNHVVRISSTRK
jgi:hypothetical protein